VVAFSVASQRRPDGKSAHNGSKESKSVYNATRFGSQNGNPGSQAERRLSMLLIIILLVLLFAGGGGYYGYSRWGTGGGLGIVGTVLLILLVLYLLGALR
jgi:hypothetical protein